MAPASRAPRTLAEQIADLDDPTPRDLDPEDYLGFERNNGVGSDEDDEASEIGGREHYEAVGEGKLRKSEELNLGKRYEGLGVTRDALDAGDSDDDPFGKGASDLEASNDSDDGGSYDDPDDVDVTLQNDAVEDEDIDSNEAFAESDDELQGRFKFLGSSMKKVAGGTARHDTLAEDDDESDLKDDEQSEVEGESEPDISGEVDTEMQDSNLSDSPGEDVGEEDGDDRSVESEVSSEHSAEPRDERAALRKLMASDQKNVAATISQAAKADAIKGHAVKRQRSTFESLLNMRIKLQKGLGAMNKLPATRNVDDGAQQAIGAAEKAAMTLWSTLDNLRQDLAKVHSTDISETVQKRKQPSASAPSEELWALMQSLESTFVPQRRTVLDKWSSKVRAATVPDGRGKLLPTAEQRGITAVLDTQLTTEADKLIQRTKISRSETQPKNQMERVTAETPSIFNDTDFYQLLLRELVEQRMDSSTAQGGAIPITTSLRAMRVKKNVDTRASKGRKMRHTVHEKLQNFMVPEDRGTWTEKARDEFFSSLLGGRAGTALREDDEAESEREEHEAEALRLFRT